ncbi:hypothetical protein BT96DRAFT_924898 [Gymnopus androsaceus JB14]|uniref:Uncharacterized protein n=1 Tax=Gymnopus androsaceus JB14 TaxID=1447944 RepID=A0A6A4H353_9AGAR|nr:hypothetical protein BT96DRAFT_924898 [Gymnopus androsaceus JB14]
MALTLKPLHPTQPQYKAISGSQLCIEHCLLPLVTHVTSVTSAPRWSIFEREMCFPVRDLKPHQ